MYWDAARAELVNPTGREKEAADQNSGLNSAGRRRTSKKKRKKERKSRFWGGKIQKIIGIFKMPSKKKKYNARFPPVS